MVVFSRDPEIKGSMSKTIRVTSCCSPRQEGVEVHDGPAVQDLHIEVRGQGSL